MERSAKRVLFADPIAILDAPHNKSQIHSNNGDAEIVELPHSRLTHDFV
jgi:hypothetical protein